MLTGIQNQSVTSYQNNLVKRSNIEFKANTNNEVFAVISHFAGNNACHITTSPNFVNKNLLLFKKEKSAWAKFKTNIVN